MSLRTIVEKKIDKPEVLKNQLLDWSQQFREMVFLDSNNYHQKQYRIYIMIYNSYINLKIQINFIFLQTEVVLVMVNQNVKLHILFYLPKKQNLLCTNLILQE